MVVGIDETISNASGSSIDEKSAGLMKNYSVI